MNGGISDAEIVRWSNVGQAYGVVSAILSCAALIGLSGSIVYQAQQRRDDRIIAWRSAHESLVRLVLDDPATFAPCIQNIDDFQSLQEVKRYMFTTLWLGYGRAGLHLGYATEADLRSEMLSSMFESPIGRELWQIRRRRILDRMHSETWFETVVEEVYQSAMAGEQMPPKEPVASTNDEV